MQQQQQVKEKFARGGKENKKAWSRNKRIMLVGCVFALLVLIAFAFLIIELKLAEKAGLPSEFAKFPSKVESKEDAASAAVSIGNDLEGLIGSLAKLDLKLS